MAKSRQNIDAGEQKSVSFGIRLSRANESLLRQAAKLGNLAVDEYVRIVAVSRARRDIEPAQCDSISLTPDEQLAFWNALHEPPSLSPAMRQLGKIMRGEQSIQRAYS